MLACKLTIFCNHQEFVYKVKKYYIWIIYIDLVEQNHWNSVDFIIVKSNENTRDWIPILAHGEARIRDILWDMSE